MARLQVSSSGMSSDFFVIGSFIGLEFVRPTSEFPKSFLLHLPGTGVKSIRLYSHAHTHTYTETHTHTHIVEAK